MKKIKISSSDDFGTLNTKYPADQVSDPDFTEGTKNIETSVRGAITKRKGGVTYTSLSTPPRDQYEAIFSDGARHLLTVNNGDLRYSSGDGNTTSVLSGLSANLNFEFATTQDRVYFGNGITKKVYDRSTNYGGVTYTFPTDTIKDMGAQAPTTALTAAGAGSGSGVAAGSYRYKVSFVYYNSQESNGGLESGVVTIAGAEDISLSAIPVGGYGVTQRKIYRASSVDSYTQYTLVLVINNNTATTALDNVTTGLTPILEDQGTPPDFTLISLFLDRLFLAGVPGDPYTIFYSEVGQPDIYPGLNTIDCNQEDPITAIVVYLDRLIVFNRRSMGQILGKTADTFRYAPIQSSVGCVDNRTVQVRVINGVPVLVWLSDKGFYAYNGNSVVYISDTIEDQINSNIQQAVVQKNKITHSDYTTFTAGTKSDGINLEVEQGSITTKGPLWNSPGASYADQTNPIRTLDTTSEWNNGTLKSNLVISNNIIKLPVRFSPTYQSGTAQSTQLVGSNIQLPVASDFTGETRTNSIAVVSGHAASVSQWIAYPVVLPRAGRIHTSTVFAWQTTSGLFSTKSVSLYTDVAGNPGSQIKTGSFSVSSVLSSFNGGGPLQKFDIGSWTPTTELAAGTYWIVVKSTNASFKLLPVRLTPNLNGGVPKNYNGTTWANCASFVASDPTNITHSYVVFQTPVTLAGSWVSPIYDALTDNIPSSQLVHTGSFPSGTYPGGSSYTTSSVSQVEASNDPQLASGVITESTNNLNGTHFLSITNKRYWRIRLTLNTNDDRQTPSLGLPFVNFSDQGHWESEVIDCSGDVNSYVSLDVSSSIPSGSSLETTIATSNSPTGPWTFGFFGSHTVRQYVKFRFLLYNSGNQSLTPSISELLFKWTVGNGTTSSEFISSAINTGTTPSGWDIFQSSFTTNGGTVQFFLRSASSQANLSSATWYSVTNGTFPNSSLPNLQWVQWRALLTSGPNQVPKIDSVTISWFVGEAQNGVRCASIFYDKNYYVALAEFEKDKNNLLYILDFEGKWRLFKDLDVATLSYFFNSPYYGDGITGNIVRFLEGTSDQGSPIELQVNTKAYTGSTEYADHDDKIKILDHVILDVAGTGAQYSCSYSVDQGNTFYDLYDTDGNSTWTTPDTGMTVLKYLRPQFTTSIPSGYSVMLKIHNNDTKECEINSWKAMVFVREQPPIITG